MISTKISILPYLAEYMIGKFNNFVDEPLKLDPHSDLYCLIWDLMRKRPINASPVDTGNLSFYLPDRRVGKSPEVYNYLCPDSALLIEQHIKKLFNLELHQLLLDNHSNYRPIQDIQVIHKFMCMYGIDSISEDALKKNFYRWRESYVKREKRREYSRAKKRGEKCTTKVPGLSPDKVFLSEECPESVRKVSDIKTPNSPSLFNFQNP
jgi:hypothetical protein